MGRPGWGTGGCRSSHISYDFARNDNQANFFENPLGPIGAFDTPLAFKCDSGEVVYRLANGFQSYVLLKSDGERLSIVPSVLVDDDSMTSGTIVNGISCLSCHYDGMKPENPGKIANLDRVRSLASDNTRRFRQADRDMIADLYPERDVFSRLLGQDRALFRQALAAAGITRTGATEPVRVLFDLFAKNVSMEAAAEFWLPIEEFTKLLNRAGETREPRKRFEYADVQRQFCTSFGSAMRLCSTATYAFEKLLWNYASTRFPVKHTPRIPAILVCCLTLVSWQVRAGDWPCWRGPTRHDITAEFSGWTGKAWHSSDVAWKQNVGEGSTSPIVVGELLYVLGWGDGHDSLHCMEAATGKEKWRVRYKTRSTADLRRAMKDCIPARRQLRNMTSPPGFCIR